MQSHGSVWSAHGQTKNKLPLVTIQVRWSEHRCSRVTVVTLPQDPGASETPEKSTTGEGFTLYFLQQNLDGWRGAQRVLSRFALYPGASAHGDHVRLQEAAHLTRRDKITAPCLCPRVTRHESFLFVRRSPSTKDAEDISA